MDTYRHFLRPLLFKLDAERAHNLACALLKRPPLGRLLFGGDRAIENDRLRVNIGDLTFPNPVGLGAGFDKDCEMVNSLMHFGFGYIVAGSVMCNPRPGNPRPRMIRDPEREALFSCMGLPSKGLQKVAECLKGRRPSNVPLIINFNGMDLREYLRCMDVLQPLGDALEISLFCPNRAGDQGDFLDAHFAVTLFEELSRRKKKPLFIKIPGYISEDERLKRLNLVECMMNYPIDGITITPESRVEDKRLSVGRGTITGSPLFSQTLRVIEDIFHITGGNVHIKASGGLSNAQNAFRAISAGATTVEMVTGFFYEGWNIANNINQGLMNLLDRYNVQDIRALRGSNAIKPEKYPSF